MSVTVDIISNRLPAMPARLNGAVKDITRTALMQAVSIADSMTPVDTGNLKNNKTIGDDFIHWHAEYAAFVDKGTVHMAPRMFATHAAERVKPQWIRALGQIEGRL